ncbi:MAG: molecular chaperone TorD family protein [Coriobacteriales bacterium]|nr:molecular chaperone TorD family protein [Coriobacteriales bacterium]
MTSPLAAAGAAGAASPAPLALLHIPEQRSRLYSFLGNSLLRIMTADTAFGLEPDFWEAFGDAFALDAAGDSAADAHIEKAQADLQRVANELKALERSVAIERVGVEYTRLFVGPGTPAAPPWETLYREGGTVLFGLPTFDMRRLFGEQGYRASPESHQFEDHIGFELLYLALRLSEAEGPAGGVEGPAKDASRDSVAPTEDPAGAAANSAGLPLPPLATEIQEFIRTHPLSFIEKLHAKASASCTAHPNSPGYYPALIELAWGLLLQNAVMPQGCLAAAS